MIHELLYHGRNNARCGWELARFLNCDIRDVTQAIERERREGIPICARSGGQDPGYYLAADAKELSDYCEAIRRRAAELTKTRAALLDTLREIQGQTDQDPKTE